VSFAAITLVLLLNECSLLLLLISLSTQSGNFWVHLVFNSRSVRRDVEFRIRPPHMQGNVNIMTTQSWTCDNGWSSNLDG
jgi:hypothetical protein